MTFPPRPRALAFLLAALALGCATPVRVAQVAPQAAPPPGKVQDAQAAPPGQKPQAAPLAQDAPAPDTVQFNFDKGVGHALLLYVPNRVFDLLDIVRARLRGGPGFGASFRATRLLASETGEWSAVYVGLRGPRPGPEIPWPFGYDRYSGLGVTVAAAAPDDNYYGKTEFGLGTQLGIAGFDVGVDPMEAVDFLAGLVFVDLEGDDF